MLEAVTFHHEIRTGSSLPLVVGASDGHRYVLKARGGGDGVLASVVDRLALDLGRRLGLPVLEPLLMRVAPGVEDQAGDPEIRELLAASYGLNPATLYLEDARPPTAADLAHLDAGMLSSVFLFDLLLLNVDRTEKNPNAILSDREAGAFHCLDFSSTMALRALVTGRRFAEAGLWAQLRRNPFFAPDVDPDPFGERLRAVPTAVLCDLVGELPVD